MPSVCVRSGSPRTLPRAAAKKKPMKRVVQHAQPVFKRGDRGSGDFDDGITPRASTCDVREQEGASSMTSSAIMESRDSSNPSPNEARDVVGEFSAPKLSSRLVNINKAKKLRFYRNGDQYFKGVSYALDTDRIRSMQPLTEDLSRTMGDSQNLPHGIRHIFTICGEYRITEIDQFEDGESYVCSSNEIFKPMDYANAKAPLWKFSIAKQTKLHSSMLSDACKESEVEPTDFVETRIIHVIRNGIKPRKVVRHLLNKKTARSFDQVMRDLTTVVKLDSGAIRKLFGLSGNQVHSLRDFFRDDFVFIAYGNEKQNAEDFLVITEESKRAGRINGRLLQRKRAMPSRNESLRDDRCGSVVPDELARHLPDELNGKLDVKQLLGDGNTALVYQVVDKETGINKALKIISKENMVDSKALITSELAIMKRLEHPFIVQMYENWFINGSYYISLELVPCGDLFEHICQVRKISERQSAILIRCLAEALKYLHDMFIVHRDVKPENLLLYYNSNGDFELKLADFGLSVELPEDGSVLTVICGTPTYVAAEVLCETGYDEKVDIWATGVILYVILCGFPPFHSTDGTHEDLFRQIIDGKFGFPSPAWSEISWSVKDLILNMITLDIDSRFSADDILNSTWIKTLSDVPEELETMAQLSVQPRLEEEEDEDCVVDGADISYHLSRRASMDELSESGVDEFTFMRSNS